MAWPDWPWPPDFTTDLHHWSLPSHAAGGHLWVFGVPEKGEILSGISQAGSQRTTLGTKTFSNTDRCQWWRRTASELRTRTSDSCCRSSVCRGRTCCQCTAPLCNSSQLWRPHWWCPAVLLRFPPSPNTSHVIIQHLHRSHKTYPNMTYAFCEIIADAGDSSPQRWGSSGHRHRLKAQ